MKFAAASTASITFAQCKQLKVGNQCPKGRLFAKVPINGCLIFEKHEFQSIGGDVGHCSLADVLLPRDSTITEVD